MSEIELLKAFTVNRSEEAFAELVRRYASLVYSTARRRSANPSLAEDITQMVFIRLAKNPPNIQTHAELAAWLHRTTVNISIDLWRSETRRRARELQAIVMEISTSDTAIWEAVSPNLDQALDQLHNEDRQAILLRFFGRKTMREVGAMLGVSEDAAKMRVSRAVDRLRTQMDVSAAACTAATLAMLLAERSVEAAPPQLAARLSAIKLSAVAVTATIGGTFFGISYFKLAVGASSLLLLTSIAVHFHSLPNIRAVTPTTNSQPVAIEITNTTHAQFSSHVPANANVSPTPKSVMLLQVVDAETAEPLAHAKIHAPTFGIGGIGTSHNFLTDSNGTVSIPINLTNNEAMNVFVVAEGHVPIAKGFINSFPANYTMKLDRAMTAGGVVVDEEGHSIAGAKVFIQSPAGTKNPKGDIDFQTCPATTDSNGNWNCSYVPLEYTNEIRFIIKKKNYAVTYPVVSVPETNLNNLILVLNHGFTVIGRVTDAQDQPVANARMTTIDSEINTATTKTDNNGNFILKGVCNSYEFYKGDAAFGGPAASQPAAPSGHADLTIEAIGFAAQTVAVNLLAATNAVNYTLAPSRILRGHVTDKSGHPIPNAIVQTDWNTQGLRAFDWQTRTDVNGQFEWDSAPLEPILYWIEANGYKVQRDVSLLADTSDHEIILEKEAAK